MKIEVVQTFPIKSVSESVLCCPDMDLVLVHPVESRDLKVCSLSTGKKIMVQKLPRYNVLMNMCRVGRWLFMRIMRPAGTQSVAFDLQELVLHDWGDSLDVRSAEAIYFGSCGHYAFFQNPKPPISWFAFRLADGEILNRPSSAQKVEKLWFAHGSYFGAHYGERGEQNYQTFRPDPEGMPTGEPLGDFHISGKLIKANWDERILIQPIGDDGWPVKNRGDIGAHDPDLKCLDLHGHTCYEVRLPLPALDKVNDPGLWPDVNAVIVSGAHGRRVVAFRQWSMAKQGEKEMVLKQWVAFDRDSGEILWHREHVGETLFRMPFVVDSHILAHDSEGIHLTHVDTGETEDFSLPNDACYPGNGYYLSRIRHCYYGQAEPEQPMPYFFWQEHGKPMVMARLAE